MSKQDVQIHYSGDDWAALYIGGRLEVEGHSSTVEEKAFERLGVTVVNDDAFLGGGARALTTLDRVARRRERTAARMERAATLRADAAAMLAEAGALEAGDEEPLDNA